MAMGNLSDSVEKSASKLSHLRGEEADYPLTVHLSLVEGYSWGYQVPSAFGLSSVRTRSQVGGTGASGRKLLDWPAGEW